MDTYGVEFMKSLASSHRRGFFMSDRFEPKFSSNSSYPAPPTTCLRFKRRSSQNDLVAALQLFEHPALNYGFPDGSLG
jgi:hypothetical protein